MVSPTKDRDESEFWRLIEAKIGKPHGKRKRLTIDQETVRKLKERGYVAREIAAYFGMSKASYYRLMKENGKAGDG